MGLRVNIKGLKFRTTDGALKLDQQKMFMQLRLSNCSLSASRFREKDDPADSKKVLEILKLRNPLELNITSIGLKLPKMIDVPGKSFRIMRHEVTVGLFKQLMDEGYVINGHNKEELLKRLERPDEKVLTCLNLLDGRALAKMLSEQTDRVFRVPTLAELKAAHKLIGHRLSGTKLVRGQFPGINWEWTEDLDLDYSSLLSLLHPIPTGRPYACRWGDSSVRLVEDIK